MRRALPDLALLLLALPLAAAGPPRDFFAFDNGTGRDQKLTLPDQAALLRRSGYSGMAVFTGTARIPEVLAALDHEKLRLLSIYVHSYADDTTPRIDPGLPEAIRQLAGRETMILLTVQGHGKDAETRAVENVREVADLAAKSGLTVCLYPHIGFFIETTPDAVRIARKAGRANVGVALNLFHTVAFHAGRCGERDLDFAQLLAAALPYIRLVSINGIGWNGDEPTILPLGEGSYDVSRFLRALRRAGVQAPVGLQCYQVKGDLEENLSRSLKAWRAMLEN